MSNSEIVQLFLVIVGLAFIAFEVITNMNDVEDDTTNIILYQATLKTGGGDEICNLAHSICHWRYCWSFIFGHYIKNFSVLSNH